MAKSKTKITTKAQVEHGAAAHPTHLRDKARNEARRKTQYIRVPCETKEIFGFPYSCCQFLGLGDQFQYVNERPYPMEAIPWAEEHNQMRLDRSYEWFSRGHGSTRRETKRKIHSFSELVVPLAPWVGAFLHVILLKRGKAGRIAASDYLADITRLARMIAMERTKNEIPFLSRHYDTDDIHLNLRLTCVNEFNQRVGDIRLRTVGKAALGYHRQVSVKAFTDRNQFRDKRSLDKYKQRANKANLPARVAATPLDIEIAEAIDAHALEQFGRDRVFQQAINTYILFVKDKMESIMPTSLIIHKMKVFQAILDARGEGGDNPSGPGEAPPDIRDI